ncbi:MAG: hypothetical protein AB1491_08595 [Thermodesulfobacteriota bacterium]
MRCLICGDTSDEARGWQHLYAKHLEPYGVNPEKIWTKVRELARPLEVSPGPVTCIGLEENRIYFNLENAALLIAYAQKHAGLSWEKVVTWLILHEQVHLTFKEKYSPPASCLPYVQANAEDYYINKVLLPPGYWQVCRQNARCATEIRNIAPLPYELRDGYFYCTLATFLAYDAVTPEDITFVKPAEGEMVEILAIFFEKIREVKDIPRIIEKISDIFPRLQPPPGVSWDNWEIDPKELRGREIRPEEKK